MTNKEMAAIVRRAGEMLRSYYTSGVDVPAESKTTRELDAIALALEAEPSCACEEGKPIAETTGVIDLIPKEYLVRPEEPGCELHSNYFLCEGISGVMPVRILIFALSSEEEPHGD